MSNLFLTQEELVELTGRKIKSKQIEVLRRMGLPFWSMLVAILRSVWLQSQGA